MGNITKTTTGIIAAVYNKQHLTEMDVSIFKYAVESFGYLIPRKSDLSITDFIELIKAAYVVEGKTKACIAVLEKAANTHKVTCSFNYLDDKGILIADQRIVSVEHWRYVESILVKQVGSTVSDLALKCFSSARKIGRMVCSPKQRDLSFG